MAAVIDCAIFMLDPYGHNVSRDAGAQRAKGYSEAEIIGQHFSVFFTVEDRRRGSPEAALAIARRDVLAIVVNAHDAMPGGGVLTVTAAGHRVERGTGRPCGTVRGCRCGRGEPYCPME